MQGSSGPHSMFQGDNVLRIGNSMEIYHQYRVSSRLEDTGHCYRSKNEVVNRVILWEPRHGRRSKGRPAKSYMNIVAADTGAERSELPGVMGNRERWKTIVDSRAERGWAVKRAVRSSCNVWCGVGLARALLPRFRCVFKPAKFSFQQTGNLIFFLQ